MVSLGSCTRARARRQKPRARAVLFALLSTAAVSSCETSKSQRELLWCVGACVHFRSSYDDVLVEFDLDKIRAKRILRKDDET